MAQGLERVEFSGALRGEQSGYKADESGKQNHAKCQPRRDDKEIAAHGKFPVTQINRDDDVQPQRIDRG